MPPKKSKRSGKKAARVRRQVVESNEESASGEAGAEWPSGGAPAGWGRESVESPQAPPETSHIEACPANAALPRFRWDWKPSSQFPLGPLRADGCVCEQARVLVEHWSGLCHETCPLTAEHGKKGDAKERFLNLLRTEPIFRAVKAQSLYNKMNDVAKAISEFSMPSDWDQFSEAFRVHSILYDIYARIAFARCTRESARTAHAAQDEQMKARAAEEDAAVMGAAHERPTVRRLFPDGIPGPEPASTPGLQRPGRPHTNSSHYSAQTDVIPPPLQQQHQPQPQKQQHEQQEVTVHDSSDENVHAPPAFRRRVPTTLAHRRVPPPNLAIPTPPESGQSPSTPTPASTNVLAVDISGGASSPGKRPRALTSGNADRLRYLADEALLQTAITTMRSEREAERLEREAERREREAERLAAQAPMRAIQEVMLKTAQDAVRWSRFAQGQLLESDLGDEYTWVRGLGLFHTLLFDIFRAGLTDKVVMDGVSDAWLDELGLSRWQRITILKRWSEMRRPRTP